MRIFIEARIDGHSTLTKEELTEFIYDELHGKDIKEEDSAFMIEHVSVEGL